MELGHNATTGMITRGLNEITRLGVKLGANPLTLSGLAGMGDLVLTCTGGLSRNRMVGTKLGQGMTMQQILDEMNMVAEGVKTSHSVYKLAQQVGLLARSEAATAVTGIVVDDPHSPSEVSEAISRLVSDHELRARMGNFGLWAACETLPC